MQPSLGRERLRRFELEAAVLARLHHPNIAQIHASGTHDGPLGTQPWFAMELIDGVDLRTHVERARLSRPVLLALFATVVDAVQHAHERGIVHRDLKPENVLVDAAGVPKVLDFGVARVHDTSLDLQSMATRTGELIGTLAYMAPEQLAGDPDAVTARSDVYALGVMLYELLAHRLPHAIAGLPLAAAIPVLTAQEPPSLARLDPSSRGDVATIVAVAMAKDANRRYATAAEFAADLRRHLDHEPIRARPASAIYRATTLLRRHRAIAVGLTFAFVALTVGLFAALWQANVADGERDRALRQLYSANLLGADDALSRSEFRIARRQLDTAPRDLRGFEWQVLSARLDSAVEVHGGGAQQLDTGFPGQQGLHVVDGGRAYWMCRVGETVLRSRTGAVLARLPSHVPTPECTVDAGASVLWRVITEPMSDRGVAERLSLTTGQLLDSHPVTFDLADRTRGDGKVLLGGRLVLSLGQDSQLVLRPLDAEGPVRRIPMPSIPLPATVESDPSGRTLMLPVASGDVHWLDLEGRELAVLRGHTNEVTAAAFSPDGRWYATASRDQSVRLWRIAAAPVCERTFVHPLQVNAVAFSPDGSLLATGSMDQAIRVFDVTTGERIGTHASGNLDGSLVAFLDDRTVAGIDFDGALHAWRTDAEASVRLAGHRAPVEKLVHLPELGLLFTAGLEGTRNLAGAVRAFDLATGEPIGSTGMVRGRVNALGTRGQTLEWTAGEVGSPHPGLSVDLRSGRWQVHPASMGVGAASRSPDGQRILSIEGGLGWSVRDAATLAPLSTEHWIAEGPAHWLRSGQGVLSCRRSRMPYGQGGMFLLEPKTLRPLRHWDLPLALTFAVDADERRVAVADLAKIVVLELPAGNVLAELAGHDLEIYGLAWSPDGKRLASCGLDRSIRLWDTTTFDAVGRFTGHDDAVMELSWDGNDRLISASGDDTVRIWETVPIRERIAARDARRAAVARLQPLIDRWRTEAADLPALFTRIREDASLSAADRRVVHQLAIGLLLATIQHD